MDRDPSPEIDEDSGTFRNADRHISEGWKGTACGLEAVSGPKSAEFGSSTGVNGAWAFSEENDADDSDGSPKFRV